MSLKLHKQLVSKGLIKNKTIPKALIKRRKPVRILAKRKTGLLGSNNNGSEYVSIERPFRKPQILGRSEWSGSFDNDSGVMSGQDWMCDLSITTAQDVSGTVLYSVIINPFMMGVSRLGNEALNWEYYRIESLEFIFSAAKAIQDGAIAGIIDNDPADKAGSFGTVLLNRNMAADATYNADNVSNSITWRMKIENPINKWKCDRTTRVSYSDSDDACDAGRFYVVVRNSLGISSTTTIGTIYVRYRIAFFKPQLELSANGQGAKYACTTGLSNTLPFGSNPLPESWSNITFYQAPLGTVNYFELAAGSYLVMYISGNVSANFSAFSAAWSSPLGGTVTEKTNHALMSTTNGAIISQVVISNVGRCAITATTTNWTGGWAILYVIPLPSNALTVNDALKKLKTMEKQIANITHVIKEEKDYIQVEEEKLDTSTKTQNPILRRK